MGLSPVLGIAVCPLTEGAGCAWAARPIGILSISNDVAACAVRGGNRGKAIVNGLLGVAAFGAADTAGQTAGKWGARALKSAVGLGSATTDYSTASSDDC